MGKISTKYSISLGVVTPSFRSIFWFIRIAMLLPTQEAGSVSGTGQAGRTYKRVALRLSLFLQIMEQWFD